MCYFKYSPFVATHKATTRKPMQAFKLLEVNTDDPWTGVSLGSPFHGTRWNLKNWQTATSVPSKSGSGAGIYCFTSERAARNYAAEQGYGLSLYQGYGYVVVELEIAGVIHQYDVKFEGGGWNNANKYKAKEAGYLAQKARVVRLCSGGQRLRGKTVGTPFESAWAA